MAKCYGTCDRNLYYLGCILDENGTSFIFKYEYGIIIRYIMLVNLHRRKQSTLIVIICANFKVHSSIN